MEVVEVDEGGSGGRLVGDADVAFPDDAGVVTFIVVVGGDGEGDVGSAGSSRVGRAGREGDPDGENTATGEGDRSPFGVGEGDGEGRGIKRGGVEVESDGEDARDWRGGDGSDSDDDDALGPCMPFVLMTGDGSVTTAATVPAGLGWDRDEEEAEAAATIQTSGFVGAAEEGRPTPYMEGVALRRPRGMSLNRSVCVNASQSASASASVSVSAYSAGVTSPPSRLWPPLVKLCGV